MMKIRVIMIWFIVCCFFIASGNVFAASLSTPVITGFAPESSEKNALRLEFKSNNTGTNFSYEIVNATSGITNNVSGSSKLYVYQNLGSGVLYKVIIRACTNSARVYSCSDWTNPATAVVTNSAKRKLSTPVLNSLKASSTNGVKLNYKVSDEVTGVEIVNVTLNKKYKTTNRKTFTETGLKSGKTYKYKIRTYYGIKDTVYSSYSKTMSITLKSKSVKKDSLIVTKSYKKSIDSKAFKLTAKSVLGKKLYYKSNNSNVAYVTSSGKVYLNEVGKTTIKVYTKTNGSYKGLSKNITITVTNRTTKPTVGQATSGNNGFGDQSGKEVATRKWYKNSSYANWNYVFRFKDPRKAEKAADAMIATCNNNKIGYDNRYKANSMSFTYAVKKAGWNPSKVNTKCATACSQCVLTMVQISGLHRDSLNYAYKNSVATAKALKKDKNFRVYTSNSYTKSYKKLRRGDILIDTKWKKHTLMVVK